MYSYSSEIQESRNWESSSSHSHQTCWKLWILINISSYRFMVPEEIVKAKS